MRNNIMQLLILNKNMINPANLLKLREVSKNKRNQVNSHVALRDKYGEAISSIRKSLVFRNQRDNLTYERQRSIFNEMKQTRPEIVAKAFQRMRKLPWGITNSLYNTTEITSLGHRNNFNHKNYAITHDDMKAFRTVLASGALPNLQVLDIRDNLIGDVGMSVLSEALGKGLLANLRELHLHANDIGNNGMKAFASAVASDSFAALRDGGYVQLFDNPGEKKPVKTLCEWRGINCFITVKNMISH